MNTKITLVECVRVRKGPRALNKSARLERSVTPAGFCCLRTIKTRTERGPGRPGTEATYVYTVAVLYVLRCTCVTCTSTVLFFIPAHARTIMLMYIARVARHGMHGAAQARTRARDKSTGQEHRINLTVLRLVLGLDRKGEAG